MQKVVQLRGSWRDPVGVLSGFADEPWAIAFLSGRSGGRWSFLARHPDQVLIIRHADATDPFAALADLRGPAGDHLAGGPPFQGGLAGLASYELGERIEPTGRGRPGDWPDLAVGRYPAVLAFDHLHRQIMAIGRGEDEAEALGRAHQALLWSQVDPLAQARGALAKGLTEPSCAEYCQAVASLIAQIHAGDLFQANLAQTWTAQLAKGVTPFDLLARLMRQSPAPFSGYFRLADRAVVSNSPEQFLGLDHRGAVSTSPIKGTRPRPEDPAAAAAADAALARELEVSPKDRAENLMIVDLMRNDLARVCLPGSIEVPELCQLQTFANVHHLVSTVTGRLRPCTDAFDLLRATFPPGSVTGAPKPQAMKVIATAEPPRGPYCGSLFWAGTDGALGSSVLIRTLACRLTLEGWMLEARAGAGIVADSDPAAEAAETRAKISAILKALA